MRVRDKTRNIEEYKGRPFDASDTECPCRPCCNSHDCGHNDLFTGKRVVLMECAIRHNNGCPHPKPPPEHIYVSARGKICKRCGFRRA